MSDEERRLKACNATFRNIMRITLAELAAAHKAKMKATTVASKKEDKIEVQRHVSYRRVQVVAAAAADGRYMFPMLRNMHHDRSVKYMVTLQKDTAYLIRFPSEICRTHMHTGDCTLIYYTPYIPRLARHIP
jgi:hypothetical protein